MIAVLMPYKNSSSTIRESIESLSKQTRNDYVLFSVNNNSSDESSDILTSICSELKVPYFNMVDNGNICTALNRGLFKILASDDFDFIARLDSDDIWLPAKLEKQISFFEKNPDISVLGTQIISFGNDGPDLESNYPMSDYDIRESMFSSFNPFAHPSIMIRTDVFYRCGVYDDIYRHCEDYQYWMKASKYFKFANLPDFLVKYRRHHNPNYNPVIPVLCKMRYGRAIMDSNT